MKLLGEKFDADTEKMVKEHTAQMSKMMPMEFSEGSSKMHTISGTAESTYKILSTDPKTSELQVDITEGNRAGNDPAGVGGKL